MKRILHLVSVKDITFKADYDWFKIDILRLPEKKIEKTLMARKTTPPLSLKISVFFF